MAKFTKTFENGIEKFELTFKGETYDFSMIPTDYGSKANKPGFDNQVAKNHPELSDNEELMEILNTLNYDDEVLEFLERLEEWE